MSGSHTPTRAQITAIASDPRLAETLTAGPAPADWRVDAACAETDPEAFYSDTNYRSDTNVTALWICRGCEVRAWCLREALASPIVDDAGIWGGTTPLQRRAMRLAVKHGLVVAA